MVLAGRSRLAMLLLVAICATALICSVFLLVRQRVSTAAALVAVAVMLHSSIFREMIFCVRPEIPLTLVVFWAAVWCARWMRDPSPKTRAWFFGLATAAVLVHGRGAELMLMPFCLLPLRAHRKVWRWVLAAGCVASLFFLQKVMYASAPFAVGRMLPEAWIYVARAAVMSGWAGIGLATCGLLMLRRGEKDDVWKSMAGLAVSGLVFYVLLPVFWDDRYLLPTLVALAVLAGGGIQVLLSTVQGWVSKQRLFEAAVALMAFAWISFSVATVPAKPDRGYHQMVAEGTLRAHAVVLIAGDSVDEGGLIVEAALADPALQRTVLRASKVLAHSDWSLNGFRLLYHSNAELQSVLANEKVSMILIREDNSLGEVTQLRGFLENDALEWKQVKLPGMPVGLRAYVRKEAGDGS